MAAVEAHLRRCRQGDFFKKLKQTLSGSKPRPVDTILERQASHCGVMRTNWLTGGDALRTF